MIASRTRYVVTALIVALFMAGACARPADQAEKKETKPGHVYKEMKPETYPLPDKMNEVLPGLLNDKIYVYRDVFSSINLVAYLPEYQRDRTARMIARAFVTLYESPDVPKDVEFWIIQVQPRPDPNNPDPSVVVWGVRPREVKEYMAKKDLAAFLQNSEYLLVDDNIIPRGKARTEQFGDMPPPPSQIEGEEVIPPDGKPTE